MEELVFEPIISVEEIEKNFDGIDFFEALKGSLEEAQAYSQGQPAGDTFSRKLALPNDDVSEIRISLNLTQKAFAEILGVSRRTVEAWESGRSTPTPTAKKLIHLIKLDPSVAQELSTF